MLIKRNQEKKSHLIHEFFVGPLEEAGQLCNYPEKSTPSKVELPLPEGPQKVYELRLNPIAGMKVPPP